MMRDRQIIRELLNSLTAMRQSRLAPDIDLWLKETISKLNRHIESIPEGKTQVDYIGKEPFIPVRSSILQKVIPFLTKWIPPGEMKLATIREYRLRAIQLEQEIIATLKGKYTRTVTSEKLKKFYEDSE